VERVQTKQHIRFIGVYPPGSSFCFCSIQRYPKLWWRKGNYPEEDSKKRLAERVFCQSTTLALPLARGWNYSAAIAAV
jgi:hypothetical protein